MPASEAAGEPAGRATTAPAAPIPLADRSPGPDLARGVMLLFIALANSHYFLSGPSVLGGYPQDGSRLDRALIWVLATFVDGRAFPLFGLLFGYGVARIAARQESLGPRAVRRMLWRRALVLLGVGFLHAVLLYVGDILTAYGVLLLLGAWVVHWKDRWLLLTAGFFLALLSLPSGDSLSVSDDPPHVTMLPPDVLTLLTERPVVSLYIALLGPVGFGCPFLLGLWAGRRQILERPGRHLGPLRLAAVVGIGAAVLAAQPVSLMLAGAVPAPDRATLEVIGPLHDASGILGGIGYAAALSLLADRLRPARRRPLVDAVVATGQRSMTCYLTQSVVWTVAFTPFLLDLSDTLTVTTTALLATGTWLLTVLLADAMRRAEYRGPFELLVRRVTYRRPPQRRQHPIGHGQAGNRPETGEPVVGRPGRPDQSDADVPDQTVWQHPAGQGTDRGGDTGCPG